MVMTDAFLKYTELAAFLDKTAVSVDKDFFEHCVRRHGVPQLIVSDSGREFLNSTMCHMITSRFSPPQKVVDHFANHSSQISEVLLHFKWVDYNALLEGGGAQGCVPLGTHFIKDLWASGGSLIGAFSLTILGACQACGRLLVGLLGRQRVELVKSCEGGLGLRCLACGLYISCERKLTYRVVTFKKKGLMFVMSYVKYPCVTYG